MKKARIITAATVAAGLAFTTPGIANAVLPTTPSTIEARTESAAASGPTKEDVFSAVFFGRGDLGKKIAPEHGRVDTNRSAGEKKAQVALYQKVLEHSPERIERLHAAATTGSLTDIRNEIRSTSAALVDVIGDSGEVVNSDANGRCLVVFIVAAATVVVSVWVTVDIDQSKPRNYQMARVSPTGDIALQELVFNLKEEVGRT